MRTGGVLIGLILTATPVVSAALADDPPEHGPPAKQAEVQYAGGSVGSVAGLLQVNVRVPADAKVTGDNVPFRFDHWFSMDGL